MDLTHASVELLELSRFFQTLEALLYLDLNYEIFYLLSNSQSQFTKFSYKNMDLPLFIYIK